VGSINIGILDLPQHVSASYCHHQVFVGTVPQKLLKQYMCCGCIWITIRPVWSVVGCNQKHILVGVCLFVAVLSLYLTVCVSFVLRE
jgi:hypothetical protein